MKPATPHPHLLTGILLAVITTIIWSGNYVVARGISQQLPPVSIAFYRWSVASLCLLPLAAGYLVREWSLAWQHRGYLLVTALTGVTIFNTLIYLAGHYTTAINLALIGTTAAPLFVLVLAAIFWRERISLLRVLGMACCLLGILILLSKGSWQQLLGLHFGRGDLLMLVSALSFAIYTLLVRKKPAGLSALSFLLVIFITGTVLLSPFYFYEIRHSAPVHWTYRMGGIILYLGIGNSVIAFFCWNASIKSLGPSGTALFGNLIPIFSSIEAVLLLGESFSLIHLLSGLLVIGGLVIAHLGKKGGGS